MCKLLGVSRSGFYDWLHAKPSIRAQEDTRLKVLITAAHRQSRETYGTRCVKHELAALGHDVGRDRVARLRRELKLRCKQRRKFVATTNSRHDLPVAENLLEQRFAPTRPGEVWVTDITYIPTAEGWLYLAGLKDVFTCEIVGYAMGERMTQDLTAQALWRAVANKRLALGVIHHSDRGSFWGTLKNELVHHLRYATRAEAQASIQEYIEIFYNRQRRHSIGFVPPALFAEEFSKQPQAA